MSGGGRHTGEAPSLRYEYGSAPPVARSGRERQGYGANREERAWRAYRAELHRFVLARVGDAAAAEDIVHEVLLRAYSRRVALRDGGKFRGWLYRIARNAIVDYYRRRRTIEELPDGLADREPDASDEAQRELARCLTPLMEELPARYRQAVMLAEIEGLTQRDIASKLGLSVSGAKSRVQRARKRLKAMLLECCRVEFDRRGGVAGYEPKGACEAC